jgi:phage tail protein
MTSEVMMALGDLRFSISTAAYTELERTSDYRHPTVDRIGSKPARQFIGAGDDQIQLSGTIYPAFRPQRQGLAQVSIMRQEAEKGEPLLMVDGRGRVWGEYVILSIRERQTTFFSDGSPRKIDFDMALGAYGG